MKKSSPKSTVRVAAESKVSAAVPGVWMISEGQLTDPMRRSDRANMLRGLHLRLTGVIDVTDFQSEMSHPSTCQVACLLADLRHMCDRYRVDFYKSLDMSYQHYVEEKLDPEERKLN